MITVHLVRDDDGNEYAFSDTFEAEANALRDAWNEYDKESGCPRDRTLEIDDLTIIEQARALMGGKRPYVVVFYNDTSITAERDMRALADAVAGRVWYAHQCDAFNDDWGLRAMTARVAVMASSKVEALAAARGRLDEWKNGRLRELVDLIKREG